MLADEPAKRKENKNTKGPAASAKGQKTLERTCLLAK
jgi:hypothetical protein